MKRVLRWVIGICLVLIILVVACILSLDTIAKSTAEKRIRQETGMETQIGAFKISLRDHTVHIQNLKLINPPEFGGSTFVDIPELFLKCNVEALRSNKLHLNVVRFNFAEIHVVENKDGKRNTDVFSKQKGKEQPSDSNTNQTEKTSGQIEFGGIDTLQVSLGKAKFTSERNPELNADNNLGIKDRIFKDIKTEEDLQSVATVLMLQIGFNKSLELLANPEKTMEKGAAVGEKAEKLWKSITTPFKKKKSGE